MVLLNLTDFLLINDQKNEQAFSIPRLWQKWNLLSSPGFFRFKICHPNIEGMSLCFAFSSQFKQLWSWLMVLRDILCWILKCQNSPQILRFNPKIHQTRSNKHWEDFIDLFGWLLNWTCLVSFCLYSAFDAFVLSQSDGLWCTRCFHVKSGSTTKGSIWKSD